MSNIALHKVYNITRENSLIGLRNQGKLPHIIKVRVNPPYRPSIQGNAS